VLSGVFKIHVKLVNYNYISWKWSYMNDLLNTVESQKMISNTMHCGNPLILKLKRVKGTLLEWYMRLNTC